MAKAYYNENDARAAATLRELIRAGLIAPGDVDERSIEDVTPTELAGYTQRHFFAGFGVWSYALRRAGWPDERPVATGSCPCQPFSGAGKGEGFADERHLWPAFFWHLYFGQPCPVFGEQVASKDGLAWLDVVSADLEAAGYGVAALDLCAAGFGAPHIRQRLFWVAYRPGAGLEGWVGGPGHRPITLKRPERLRAAGRMDESIRPRLERLAGNGDGGGGRAGTAGPTAAAGEPCGLALADDAGRDRSQGTAAQPRGDGEEGRLPVGDGAAGRVGEPQAFRPQPGPARDGVDGNGMEPAGGEQGVASLAGEDVVGLGYAEGGGCGERGDAAYARSGGHPDGAGHAGGLEYPDRTGPGEGRQQRSGQQRRPALIDRPGTDGLERPGPTNGYWGSADWLWCRDERWRPVEPGASPLAHGAAERMGRLRGYGNAIVAPVAQAFIEAVMEGMEA